MTKNPYLLEMIKQRRSEYTGHPDLGEQVDADTWLTPRFILDKLGKFDMDPCAAAGNPDWVGATISITKRDDGLSYPWGGRVFMNPPFSATRAWLRKHARYGRGVSLVPATVESQVWQQEVWPKASAVLFLAGRTRFCNPDGSSTSGRPLRSIALISWGEHDRQALISCGLAGVLVTSWHQTK